MPINNRYAEVAATLPSADETRARLEDYIARTAMSWQQLAAQMGYSTTAIYRFRTNQYLKHNRTDAQIRQAIEDFMQRHPIGLPSTDVAGVLYETENVRQLREWFDICHATRSLAFCYGPPGSQKTYTMKHVVSEFNRRELARDDAKNRAYYVYASVNIRPRDLMVKLCEQAGAIIGRSIQGCMRGLRQMLRDTQTIFVIDEAQHLSIDCLEALREMHDEEPRIGALLAGSHELKRMFDRRAAELEQWNSRMLQGVELTGVSEVRAKEIIQAELPQLSDKQIKRIVVGALVPDAYSRTHPKYINVRRLFNTIDEVRASTKCALLEVVA